MEVREINAIELLMDNMNQGVIYVDSDRKIQLCNKRAKKITGIVVDNHFGHDSGQISEGDIVIIADNKLGEDDGNLGAEELKLLNIDNPDIHKGDMLVAVGVYRNEKIEPVYKYMRGRQINVPLTLDVSYYGFHIEVSVDTEQKNTRIAVNGDAYPLNYYYSIGNMVVIDSITGEVKFFQSRGYSTRDEEVGKLLRGSPFSGKNPEDSDVDVSGMPFLDFFDPCPLSDHIFAMLEGKEDGIHNQLYEINKRPLVCTTVLWKENEVICGVFLMIRGAENLENLLADRDEIIRQIEEKDKVETDKELDYSYPEETFKGFMGQSSKAREVKYMAYKAAANTFTVIITGESGTGKSKLAKEIHMARNPKAPFVEVNCNAIAPSLFESELFGYVGGAFTGAKSEGKVGFFEAADKGTIFLDEIGDIPLDIQVKLLYAIQDKVIYRVGSSKPIHVDVRIIAATNKNLEEEVIQGRFRRDLFYRINVFPIDIPPIRERKADLYPLINQILKTTCEKYGLEQKQFSGEALQALISYNWPGNVRELENAIERAVILCESNIIYSEYLRIGKGPIPTTMKEMLATEESRILETTLQKYNGDKQKAMEELDLSKSVFYEKLKKYHLQY